MKDYHDSFHSAKTEMLKTTAPFDLVNAFSQGWQARGEYEEQALEPATPASPMPPAEGVTACAICNKPVGSTPFCYPML